MPPPTGRPHPDQPPGRSGRRRTGLLVGSGVTALALVGGLVAWQVLFSLGAPTPIAAAEGLVEAANEQDLIGVFRLLPPDEVRIYRSIAERASDAFDDDLGLGDELALDGATLDVAFGPPQGLADGLVRIPVDRITLEVVAGSGAVASGLQNFDEDLRGEGVAIIAVERDGSWFVSPFGTLLDAVATEVGYPAGPATSRHGSASPGAVVDDVALAWSGASPLIGVLGLLDPEELQVFDHYADLLRSVPGDSSVVDVSVTYEEQGSDVHLRRFEYRDDWGVVAADLQRWCVEEEGRVSCAREEIQEDLARGVYDPWQVGFVQSLLDPELPQPVVGSVQRGDRHYLSLERTVAAIVDPMLDRMDDHTLAGMLLPTASPHAVDANATVGEEFTVELVNGWAAVRFPDHPDRQVLTACPPAPDLRSSWSVDGVEVVAERINDRFEVGSWSPGVVVGVRPGSGVDTVRLRLVDAAAGAC